MALHSKVSPSELAPETCKPLRPLFPPSFHPSVADLCTVPLERGLLPMICAANLFLSVVVADEAKNGSRD
jgi:hypothetical protein